MLNKQSASGVDGETGEPTMKSKVNEYLNYWGHSKVEHIGHLISGGFTYPKEMGNYGH